MSEQLDWLTCPRPPQARHQISLARCGREHLDIRLAEARPAKSRGHGLGRASGVARRGHRVDLDKLLVDVDGQLLLSAPALCMYRGLEPGQTHQRNRRAREMPSHPIPPIDLARSRARTGSNWRPAAKEFASSLTDMGLISTASSSNARELFRAAELTQFVLESALVLSENDIPAYYGAHPTELEQRPAAAFPMLGVRYRNQSLLPFLMHKPPRSRS